MIRKVVKRRQLGDPDSAKDDLAYWLSRPPAERVEAVDILRKQRYGTLGRIKIVARVITRS